MKLKILIPILLFFVNANGQTAKFEKDGKIWISYDPLSSSERHFYPIENDYKCIGNFMENITDTANVNEFYKISFKEKWLVVKAVNKGYGIIGFTLGDRFCDHIMFKYMVACFDINFLYCQCGDIFKIINKNF